MHAAEKLGSLPRRGRGGRRRPGDGAMRASIAALCLAALAAAGAAIDTEYADLHEIILAPDAAEGIRAAVAAGEDIDRVDPGAGQTPLMSAVLRGKADAVAALLELGADTSVGEKDGYTPMHGAGFQGRSNLVPLLHEHGVPLSAMHADGFTPMHRACWGAEARHVRTVRAFLRAGVPLEQPAADGRTCLDFGSPPVRAALEALLDGAEL